MKPTKNQYMIFLIIALIAVLVCSYLAFSDKIPLLVLPVLYLLIYLGIRYVQKNGIKK